MKIRSGASIVALVLAVGVTVAACTVDDAAHMHRHAPAVGGGAAPAQDTRERVRFPDALREHTLANMRAHLAALTEIQAALAAGAYDRAAELAERELGMSSLEQHGAHEVAGYMPAGMQAAGTAMHRAASRFAVAARNASVTSDLGSALASLAVVGQTCVACHAAWRLH
ncbi:MAG: hypothetical protein AB7P21_13760 [Lautropia sp.]